MLLPSPIQSPNINSLGYKKNFYVHVSNLQFRAKVNVTTTTFMILNNKSESLLQVLKLAKPSVFLGDYAHPRYSNARVCFGEPTQLSKHENISFLSIQLHCWYASMYITRKITKFNNYQRPFKSGNIISTMLAKNQEYADCRVPLRAFNRHTQKPQTLTTFHPVEISG